MGKKKTKMDYYIAADGGGTKLQVILYNDRLQVVNSARMSGTNTYQRTEAEVWADMEALLDSLIPEEITELAGADLCILKYARQFLELLEGRCRVRDAVFYTEGEPHLAAAGAPFGIVAQAGTGSDAFLLQPGRCGGAGGWGYLLGDEGSGYDIGLHALKAAIHAYENRGPKTAILKLLMEEWKLDKLWDVVDRVMGGGDYRHLVASVSYIAARAAREGDVMALGLFRDAGHELACLVKAVIAQNGGSWVGPVVASGGVWKGHPCMLETFCQEVRADYPKAEIIRPIFEPVVGCGILRRFAKGESFGQMEEVLRAQFYPFYYQ